jgi:hypothetical protein
MMKAEGRPTYLRLAALRARWGGISRTTLFSLQRKHPELAAEYPFGSGIPVVRLAAIEAFEARASQPAPSAKAA